MPALEEVRIRSSRRMGVFALGIGGLGLALVAFGLLQTPLFIFAVGTLIFSGLLLLIDRRVKLVFSEAGIRYARWGPSVVPWHEFAGYRWVQWRHQSQLQLLPRRPSELVDGFSAYGKLNNFCYRLLRLPPFSIAAQQLEALNSELEEFVRRYLPEQPAG
ncbi:MAG: hypothetical protein ACE5GX_18485 [Thermoanaerobaculia bacterium]